MYNIKKFILFFSFFLFGIFWINSSNEVKAADMYRVYNPNSGEHFYTANHDEKLNLVNLGWHDEGTGWTAPDSGIPVYRLYNANAGDHHYTTSESEKNTLVAAGWNDEGICWYSDTANTVPLYRLYNPNSQTATHHYTTDYSEFAYLVSIGWRDEGISWYGTGYGMNRNELASYFIYEKVNALRASLGVAPLNYDSDLLNVAAFRANELITLYSHTRPDGSGCVSVYDDFGYDYQTAGENILMAGITYVNSNISAEDLAEECYQAWYNSPGHYQNMINSRYQDIGVAITQNTKGISFGVQNFGTRQ